MTTLQNSNEITISIENWNLETVNWKNLYKKVVEWWGSNYACLYMLTENNNLTEQSLLL